LQNNVKIKKRFASNISKEANLCENDKFLMVYK